MISMIHRESEMKSLITLLAVLAFSVTADDRPRFISAGVGMEDRAMTHAADYPMKLVFADSDGHYLSSVDVTIKSADGTVWDRTTSKGPWLFVATPPGSYTIEATRQSGPTLTKKAIARKKRQQEVVFHFPVRTDPKRW